MPLKIIRNDITKVQCDAIVNAAKSSLLGGGGVDGAIHKAAGKKLLYECMKLGGCKVGQAKITKGYDLPCKYVIHTVGPRYTDGLHGEEEALKSCYKNSLNIAKKHKCKSIAFPLISAGTYGYPKDRALKAAVDVISGFLLENDMLVYIVVYDKSAFGIGEKLFDNISSYIDDNYVESHFEYKRNEPDELGESCVLADFAASEGGYYKEERNFTNIGLPNCSMPKKASLEDAVSSIDESFSQMLLRKIDEKGMTDAECYKKANIDRKLFSKIRGDIYYKPKKTTVIAFAVSLELSLEETNDMLMKAGYALSHSNKFDIIIEYFIKNGNYNVFEINEALFQFDQSLLGA